MRRKPDQGRLLLHLDIWAHVVHWGVLMRLRHWALVECGGLVGELVRRIRLGMLRLHPEWIDILKMVRSKRMGIEAV